MSSTLAEAAPRLPRQVDAVRELLKGGRWYTLQALAEALAQRCGVIVSLPGVSARLRDLRKPNFGGHTIEKRCLGDGLYEYRLA